MQEFKHSVKVPRNYKLAATILRKALTEGASVKSLIFEDKLKHYRTNVLYALISEAIKHNADIEKLFEITEILKNEPRLDPWLAKILAVELLYGKKDLPGKSKPEITVASYKKQFEEHFASNPNQTATKGVRRPRYVRINTNHLTTSDAIRAFQEEEYRFIRCTSGPYDQYLEQVKQLGEYDFMQDYHVKTVFVFAPGTKLHEHPLYLENKIILQDKATAMAVQLLAPPAGSVVMDMCAAPGMKTTQLAAYMKNQGTVYAVEQNAERYKTLCEFVEKTGSTCVKTLHKDALEIKKGEFPDVEYVLLDPSCSGSGMDLCAHSYIEDARLARLTSLQEKFLKHAMHAFPNVKKIVYSTCSILSQENERVVTNVVSQSRAKWNVLNVKELLKDQWNNFGTGMYGSMGTRCMYARSESDLTTGFFLAVLEKDPKYFLSIENNNVKEKHGKLQTNDEQEGNEIDYIDTQEAIKTVANINDSISENSQKKNKIKKSKKEKETNINISSPLGENDVDVAPKKKKHKKNNCEESVSYISIESCENATDSIECSIRSKGNKTKYTVSDNDCALTNFEKITDDNVTKKKRKNKSKDKKRQDIFNNETLNDSIEHVQNIDNSVTKKKKKKNSDINIKEEGVEELFVCIDKTTTSNINENPEIVIAKLQKKEKRNKNKLDGDDKELKPVLAGDEISQETYENPENAVTKKKKKRKHHMNDKNE